VPELGGKSSEDTQIELMGQMESGEEDDDDEGDEDVAEDMNAEDGNWMRH
jgi:hypothetical protein